MASRDTKQTHVDSKVKNRPQRRPIGLRDKAKFPQREGYVRRVVEAKGGRIAEFQSAGYTLVENSENLAPSDPSTPADFAGQIDMGDGKKGYLMEIPEDLYNEYQQMKNEYNDKIVGSTEPQNEGDMYGVYFSKKDTRGNF